MKKQAKLLSIILIICFLASPIISCKGTPTKTIDTHVSPTDSSAQTNTEAQETSAADSDGVTTTETITVDDIPAVTFPSMQTQSKIYVNNTIGKDTNTGADKSNSLKTLNEAYNRAEQSNSSTVAIVLCDNYVLNDSYTEPAHKKNITLTSENGSLSFAGLRSGRT